MESAYRLEPTGVAAGNVTFYPKVNSLVINADSYAALSEAHREFLARPRRHRSWAIDTAPSDADSARAYCERGGTIVNASDSTCSRCSRRSRRLSPTRRDPYDQPPDRRDHRTEQGHLRRHGAGRYVRPCVRRTGRVDRRDVHARRRVSVRDHRRRPDRRRDHRCRPSRDEPRNLRSGRSTVGGGASRRPHRTRKATPPNEGTYSVDGGQVTVTFPSLSIIEVYGWTRTDDGDLVLTPSTPTRSVPSS